MITKDDELDNGNSAEEAKIEEELLATDLSDTEDDSEVGDEESESLRLDSPELIAKRQLMHEGMTVEAQIEAALFASPKPMRAEEIRPLISHVLSVEEIEALLQKIFQDYAQRGGGFTLEHLKGSGYQFRTQALAAPIMATMFATRPRPLSRAALETLSVIAYRQPCTRAAVEYIRGVDAGSIFKNLLERDLIKCVGRKEDAVGKPMIFSTTDHFLSVFGISSIKDLPPLSSFQASSEVMQQALQELDQLEAVDVEGFVGDGQEISVGDGLLVE